MGYQSTFIQGLGWSGGLKILSKLLTALKFAILARVLLPGDFGLFSLVLVSLSIVEVFAETGINTVILQSKKAPEYFLNTAWVISIVRGIFIAGIMLSMSWPLQVIYNSNNLVPLIAIASLVPIIRGFINPAIITLHKDLHFRKDTLYRFTLVIVDVLAAIGLVLVFRSVYGLVLSILFHAVADVLLSFLLVKQKPQFRWQKEIGEEIFEHTKWLNSFSVLDYLNKNLDDLIIGRVLGISNLGFYRNAYASTQSGTAELGLSVIHASFPVYSKIGNDLVRLRIAFFKVVRSFSLLLLFPTLLFVFFPTLIVQVLLGSQWLAIVPLLPILAIAGYIQGVFNISSSLFLSQKQYRMMLITLLISFLSMTLSLIPFSLQWGLTGAAFSILLSRLIAIPFFVSAVYNTLYPTHSS